MRKVNPNFARSLEQLLDYEGADVASVFTLDWPRSAELGSITHDARDGYVRAYVEWFFKERFQVQASAFCDGFRAVVGPSELLSRLVTPQQLEQIICGSEQPMDIAAVRRKATTNGWEAEDASYLKAFWEVVESFSEEERHRFAVFVSSSARTPLKGWGDFQLQVQRNGQGDDRLPTAYTCFNLLLLPLYSSTEVLRTRLLHAIKETQGFGLN